MRKGFTLIELLVVIAIIAILAAILFPVFGKAREKARQTHCTNNQKSFATAVQIYTQEHDETFPKSETFWGDIKVDKGALKCMTVPSLGNGYVYNNSLAGKGIGEIPNPTDNAKMANADDLCLTADGITKQPNGLVNILYTNGDVDVRHNNKAIVSYADGHVEMSTSDAIRGIEQGLMPPGPRDADFNTSTPFGAANGPVSSWAVTYDADGAGAGAAVPVTANEISPFPLVNGANPSYTFKKFGVYKVTGTSTSMASNTSTWDVTIKAPWMTASTDLASLSLWISAEAISGVADAGTATAWPVYYPGTTGNATGSAKYKANWSNGKPSIDFTGGGTNFTVPGYAPALGDFTIITVCEFVGSGQWQYCWAQTGTLFFGTINSSMTTRRKLAFSTHSSYMCNLGEFAQAAPDTLNNSKSIYGFRHTNTAPMGMDWKQNGGAQTAHAGTAGSVTSSGQFYIGGDSATTGTQFRGRIAELIIYNTRLDDTKYAALYDYVKAKYGL